ncbi:MAG: DUF3473 domain-containing protein [Epsilonproteobacteria bacterium]|nr:DUF3473 domain-containing protein [Campylobacterota bacterium]
MVLPPNYKNYPIWLTIDVEKVEDANFGITPKKPLNIDYPKIIEDWINLCEKHQVKSTAFVLGSFAKEYPQVVKRLKEAGHEIASHGLRHELVYKLEFKEWKKETLEAKKLLEDLIGDEVKGYRSPSWTLPFKREYYEALVELGFSYSSSYFPFKTYMYGNSIDKKQPFTIYTPSGEITEIPIPKQLIPFSGGFYMRILPFWLIKILFSSLIASGHKPIIYTHPYELIPNLFRSFLKSVKVDLAYFLTFANVGDSLKRFDRLLESFVKDRNVAGATYTSYVTWRMRQDSRAEGDKEE